MKIYFCHTNIFSFIFLILQGNTLNIGTILDIIAWCLSQSIQSIYNVV